MSEPRILVVDDERFFREAIRDVLGAAGLEVEAVETGEAALERLEERRFAAVVLDLQLPDLHGLEVLRRARTLRPELRVVILSAHTEQANVLEALRLGAFDYLAKPLHEEELVFAVRRALATYDLAVGWHGLRERLGRLEGALAALLEQARTAPSQQELREGVVRCVSEVLGAAKTSLLLLDEGPGELRVAAAHGRKIPEEELAPVALGEGVAGVALARGEPILVADVGHDGRFPDLRAARGYSSGSFAVVPLPSSGGPIGVLCATDRRDGPMDADDVALLRILAQQVARLLDASGGGPIAAEPEAIAVGEEVPGLEAVPGGDLRGAELVRAICDAVTAEVEPARVLEAALRQIGEALDAAPVSLYLAASTGELVREAEWDGGVSGDRARLPACEGLTGFAYQSGAIVASDAPARDPRFEAEVDRPANGAERPLLCGPIRFRGKTLGVFRAFPKHARDAAPALGELLGAALSAAVRNVLLYRSLVETIEEVAAARREARPA